MHCRLKARDFGANCSRPNSCIERRAITFQAVALGPAARLVVLILGALFPFPAVLAASLLLLATVPSPVLLAPELALGVVACAVRKDSSRVINFSDALESESRHTHPCPASGTRPRCPQRRTWASPSSPWSRRPVFRSVGDPASPACVCAKKLTDQFRSECRSIFV